MAKLPQVPPTTPEQQKWLKANPTYARTSHAALGRFTKRGTLRPDGTFIAESPRTPITDGNGSFGVGIPAGRR